MDNIIPDDLSAQDHNKINRYGDKMARKMAFSKFVSAKKTCSKNSEDEKQEWVCCGDRYDSLKKLHVHIGRNHQEDIKTLAHEIVGSSKTTPLIDAANGDKPCEAVDTALPTEFGDDDMYPWLPIMPDLSDDKVKKVLLFYKYRDITNQPHVKVWQETLCKRLKLTGKVRIASEGLNGTVCGTEDACKHYIKSVREHPLFLDMTEEEFKQSDVDFNVFNEGLKVGIYQEAVPMGVDPENLSYKNTGKHLTPEEFHQALTNYHEDPEEKNSSVFVDCRNFYESKIGRFKGAVDPNVRKFSYWPEYVDANREMFENKKVFMYCTGGIRCERGSAYLKENGIGSEVYQLHGGIHKYIEKFPDGYFRGKLFVFDDRYSIQSNNDVISECSYCSIPWDTYEKCRSPHCHQLVLSCSTCRDKGLDACCRKCQINAKRDESPHEECDCTSKRPRLNMKD